MMFLRRTLAPLALIGLLFVTLPACAQSLEPAPQQRAARGQGGPGGDPAERLDRQMASLDEAVDLTSRQETQVRALLEEQAANRPERGARGSGDREARRAQQQAQREAMNSKIEALLTPEQVTRFRAWSEAQRENQRGRRGGRRGNG